MDADEMDIVELPSLFKGISDGSVDGGKKAPTSWNTLNHREECDVFRSKLTDQGFNPADYGDPLSKEKPMAKIYSRTFSEKAEERFKSLAENLQKNPK